MPESLAVRRAGISTAVTRVHEVLDAFASRDHTGELLTAVRHFPAREAQWAEFPAWVHPNLVSAYAAPIRTRLRRRRRFTPARMWSLSRPPLLAKRSATTCQS